MYMSYTNIPRHNSQAIHTICGKLWCEISSSIDCDGKICDLNSCNPFLKPFHLDMLVLARFDFAADLVAEVDQRYMLMFVNDDFSQRFVSWNCS